MQAMDTTKSREPLAEFDQSYIGASVGFQTDGVHDVYDRTITAKPRDLLDPGRLCLVPRGDDRTFES